MLKLKAVIIAFVVILCGLSLVGCGSNSSQSASISKDQIQKAIKDELTGLSSIEADVNKGDFDAAAKLFKPLHDEYHASVLPPIQSKNANMAEDMHAKFDALDDALIDLR